MKRHFLFIIFLLAVAISFINGCIGNSKNADPAIAIKSYYNKNIDSVIMTLDDLKMSLSKKTTINKLQENFLQSRLYYKKVESIAEYYFQGLTKRINGAALPDVKTEDGVVWDPQGFQVLEQLLFSQPEDNFNQEVEKVVDALITDLKYTVSNIEVTTIAPTHIEEMLQHQLIRIAAMGITGFDTPLSFNALPECASALQGIADVQNIYHPESGSHFLDEQIIYLQAHNDFDNFDRLHFITVHLMPASDYLSGISSSKLTRNLPFSGGFSSLMRGKNFNPDFFSNYAIAGTNSTKIELGKKLFYDNILSTGNLISCGSCHQQDKYFTDGKPKASNFIHSGSLSRNTPTLLYAGFQNNQFYDSRSVSLEDQVNEVMLNKNEFNSSHAYTKGKLLNDKEYKALFAKAFGVEDSISSFFIRNAISAYVRSLSTFSSPFDYYINGNKNALSAEQIKGFNLFAGKAKCATCHFIPLFNGTVPPWYNKSESEIIGVPSKAVWVNASIDSDSGRYKINPFPELLYAFKTPTVRNSEKTGPYMHNGVYKSLDEVVEFYHKGGGVGLGINLPFQTLPFDSLQLSVADKKAIVAFMQSLTDNKIN